MNEEKENCRMCRFYHSDQRSYGNPSGPCQDKQNRLSSMRGFCRKQAPTAIHPRLSTEAQGYSTQHVGDENYMFPVVPADLWCGDYADCGLTEEEIQ